MEEILIKSLPKVVFAHNYTTEERYVNYLPACKNFFELSYSRFPALKSSQGENRFVNVGGGVTIQTRELDIQVEADGIFETHCLGVEAEHKIGDLGRVSFSMEDKEMERVKEIIDEIILLFNFYPERKNKMNALLFEAIDIMSEKYAKEKKEGDRVSGEITYANKIKKYVKSHIAEKINLNDLSKLLGVSVSYLCIVFKRVTGESIVTYANKYRLYLIKNYVVSQNMTLKEACALVGINDTAYASRLFKKHEKQSLREFKVSTWENPERIPDRKKKTQKQKG